MNTLLLTLALALSPVIASEPLSAQSLADITQALGSGNSDALAAMMDAEVELSVLGTENLYSRDQAKQQLATFFCGQRTLRLQPGSPGLVEVGQCRILHR